ncbi:hypothetical protein WME98_03950 [Sorangium sp. So ce296]|uniref:hypothetical protein n=1 Tax=Sorangium sp. So ce296 TaxID=3133296 RepID=UPI003F607DF6
MAYKKYDPPIRLEKSSATTQEESGICLDGSARRPLRGTIFGRTFVELSMGAQPGRSKPISPITDRAWR